MRTQECGLVSFPTCTCPWTDLHCTSTGAVCLVVVAVCRPGITHLARGYTREGTRSVQFQGVERLLGSGCSDGGRCCMEEGGRKKEGGIPDSFTMNALSIQT